MKNKKLLYILIAVVAIVGVYFVGKSFAATGVVGDTYDKLKVDHVTIKSRVTGTAPFNETPSDTEGSDVTGSDEYIRTFDYIKYTVEVGISPTSSDPELQSLKGGIIKVMAELPNQDRDGPVLMRWQSDAWMEPTTLKYYDDSTKIYAEYRVPSGISVVNATQNLSFTIRVDGYKRALTDDMKPKFTVWMDGNEPDNELYEDYEGYEESTTPSVVATDDRALVKISGKPSYDAALVNEEYINVKGTREININGTMTEVNGQYVNFGIVYQMVQPVSGFPDLRGVEYPGSSFTANYNLTYLYDEVGGVDGYQEITADNPKAYNILNGTEVVAITRAGEALDAHWPRSRYTWALDGLPYGVGDNKYSVSHSGDITYSLNGQMLSVTNSNYLLNGHFPYQNISHDSDYNQWGENYGYFVADVVELFIPYYDDGNASYNYQLRIQLDSVETTDYSGNTVTEDKIITNNGFSKAMRNQLGGELWAPMYTPGLKYRWYTSDASQIVGYDFYSHHELRAMDGPYLGGMDNLVVWSSDFFDLNYLSGETYYTFGYWSLNGIHDNDPHENRVVKYGVSKTYPSEGLTDRLEINNAVYDDFTWYDTVAEAQQGGRRVAALYYSDPSFRGESQYVNFDFGLKMLDRRNNIGKVGIIRHKPRVFPDAERTQVMYYGGECNYDGSCVVYHATEYNKYGEIIAGATDHVYGESVLVLGLKSGINLNVADKDVGGNSKKAYDVGDNYINLVVKPSLTNGKAPLPGDKYADVTVTVVLPEGLSYDSTELDCLKYKNSNSSIVPEVSMENGQTILKYVYKNWQINREAPTEIPELHIKAEISASLENNQELEIKAVVYTPNDIRDEATQRTSRYGVIISNLAGAKAAKKVDRSAIDLDESFTIDSLVGNNSEEDLNEVRTLDILPRDGDKLRSKFSGTYTITVESLAPGQEMYYTTANINTNYVEDNNISNCRSIETVDVGAGVSYDRYCKITAKNVNISNGQWIQVHPGDTIPSNATAIVTRIGVLNKRSDSGSNDAHYSLTINTSGNKKKDQYVFLHSLSSANLIAAVKSNVVQVTVVERKIAGYVFGDIDGDNLYTSSDDLIKNTNVYLLDENRQRIMSTVTDDYGSYEFSLPSSGKYYVEFEPKNTWAAVAKGTESNASKANPTTWRTDLISNEGPPTGSAIILVDDINLGVKRRPALLVVKHLDVNDHSKVLYTEERRQVYYSDEYETFDAADSIEEYDFHSTGGDPVSGVIDKDEVTVIYYYIYKPAKLTVRHYEIDNNGNKTERRVCDTKITTFNGTTPRLYDSYTANPCDLAANNMAIFGFESVEVTAGEGTINGQIVTGTHKISAENGGTIITYYYKIKKTTLSVYHYAVKRNSNGVLEKTTDKVYADDITQNIEYGTSFNKDGLSSDLLNTPYKNRYIYKESLDELINVNSKAGVISTDNPTIKFYYEPKPSKLRVRYYKAGTETRVPGVTQDYEYTNNILYDDKFDVTELTHKTGFGSTWINNETPGVAVSNLYKLDSITITGASNTSTAGNKATGTFNSDEVVVTFYYVRRTATLKVNHLKIENGVCGPNNAPNATNTTETIYVGDAYTVSESPDVISIYTFDHSEGDPVHVTNIVENRVYTVNMCYKVREASVTSRYLICDADRQVGNNNPVTEQVPYETTYNGQRKNIDGYVYKGVRNSLYPNDPDKGDPETGRVIKGEYRIDYCYLRQYTLKVKHVDRDTGTVLQTNPDVILEEGQSFTTSRITREGYIDAGVTGPTEGRAQSNLADGNGVINVTYYYRRVFTLTVKHLRKTDREKLIEEDDVTRNIPYGQQYFKYHLDIESYYPDGVEGNAIGTITGDTTVIFLYSPVMYNIIEKYVDCDSKSVLHQEKWSQSPYLSEPEYSKIDIANYNYQAVETDAEHSTLNQALGTAKVKIEKEYTTITYCYRQKEAKLIVNHLEDGTDRVLATQEVTTGLKWGNTYNTSKKTIENYSKSRDSGNTSGTVGASSVNANNEIVVTYWYQQNRGSLTVRYTECSSDRVIHAPNEFAMSEGASYDTRPYKLEIPYYQYERVTGDETGTIHGDVVVTYCYRRLSGHLTVIYKDAVTHEEIADRTSLDWTLGETYNTIPYIKTIDNYASPPVSHEGQETGTMGNPSSDVEVTYYYDKSKVELIVKYVDMDTNTEFPNSRVVETKNYGDRYTTTQKSFQYYHFVRVDKPESGYIYQQLIVTYYYRRDKGIVRTYYRDIETQEEIAKREEEEKWYEEDYDTVRKEIPKYDYVEVEGTPSGTLLEDEVTVTYKYRKQRGSVIVSHINRATGAKFVPDETTVYKLDEHYETSSREFENFELVATPDNYVGVVTTTEPIHVNYYYDQLKGVVITRYKDEDTKEELLPTSRQGYNYGETYSTIKREVDNYHYTRTAGVPTGVVGEEIIEVTYFYRRNIGTLTVEHIDAVTGRDLLEPRVEEYPYGTPYSTHREIFENYEYVRVTGNETGTIYGDVEVKYYYRTKDALLTINYLEDGTGNVLKTREVYNVKWGDAYSVSPVRIENFEYVRSDGDAERGTINGDKVINYYYKRIEANLIVHHLEYGTERILANEDREIVYYGLDYSTSSKEIEGYKMVATDGDDTHGVVSKKKIEVTYYYDRREAEVITLYLEQGTNNELSNSERVGYNFGDTYVTNAREITNYELVDHEGDLTGKVTQEITYVTYYYAKKKGTVTIKYLDESDLHYLSTGEPDDENPIVEEKEYGDTYTSVEKTFEDYELSRIEGNPEGTVDGDVIVIYYYKKREGRVVAKYLELLTNTELHSETVTTHKYGEGYQTVKQNIKDYDFVMVDGEETGTVRSPEIVVTYYYQKKNAHIISRYVEEGTNKQLATPQEQIVAYGKYYTTTSSGEVPENYELVRKTDNYEGIARQEEIEVYYYYRKKDSQLETKITKEGTDEITSRDEEVSYEINYEAIITDYIGKATVTIVDTLPYKLDTSYNNVLHGGVYNEYKNTIEWTEEIENFNSYDNDQLLITKNITVKYKDVEATERTMVNTVKGKIKLSNNVKEVENNFITRISIPGTIIVHHYIKGTTEELFPTEITEGLVGETYISHEQSLEGYKVVTKPANETHTFIEGELEVIYEYERIKFKLDVEVIGGVGEITGEEEIFYGDDSTPENIVITPGEGYEIVKIMVNGVEYEITDPDGMILDNFINVQEDIIVQVTFDLKPITVPITGSNSKLVIIASILVILSGLVIALKTGFITKLLKR